MMLTLKKMSASAATMFALGAPVLMPAPAQAAVKTFDVTWSNQSEVAVGFAALTLDTALITVSTYSFPIIPIAQVQDLTLTIVGSGGGVSYAKSDFSGISFTTASPLDLNRELIGQLVTLHKIIGGQDLVYQAPYGVVDDGRTGSFNLFSYLDSTPHSVLPFQIVSPIDAEHGDLLHVSSILPRASVVPEPADYALWTAGIGLVWLGARRAKTKMPLSSH